jgi:hypothetical protein
VLALSALVTGVVEPFAGANRPRKHTVVLSIVSHAIGAAALVIVPLAATGSDLIPMPSTILAFATPPQIPAIPSVQPTSYLGAGCSFEALPPAAVVRTEMPIPERPSKPPTLRMALRFDSRSVGLLPERRQAKTGGFWAGSLGTRRA